MIRSHEPIYYSEIKDNRKIIFGEIETEVLLWYKSIAHEPLFTTKKYKQSFYYDAKQ